MHTMEYSSAFKRKETLTHTTIWMNLEDFKISEISGSQKDKYFIIPLIGGTKKSNPQRQKVGWCCQGLEVGR